jgi:hypothetical protein
MQTEQEGDRDPDDTVPPDLSQAGVVVDRAIEFMMGRNIGSLSIASALLGGALGLLARTLEDEAVVQVLNNAIASVRAGDLRRPEAAERVAGEPEA